MRQVDETIFRLACPLGPNPPIMFSSRNSSLSLPVQPGDQSQSVETLCAPQSGVIKFDKIPELPPWRPLRLLTIFNGVWFVASIVLALVYPPVGLSLLAICATLVAYLEWRLYRVLRQVYKGQLSQALSRIAANILDEQSDSMPRALAQHETRTARIHLRSTAYTEPMIRARFDTTLTDYQFFDPSFHPCSKHETRPQGFVSGPAWMTKFKGCPRVRSEVWETLNEELAKQIGISVASLRSLFNGEPISFACQAARAAGLPVISSGPAARKILQHDSHVNVYDFDTWFQGIMDSIHKSTAGRTTRAHVRLYTTAFTKFSRSESDLFSVMRSISNAWSDILATHENARRLHQKISDHKVRRRDRPIATATYVAERILRDSIDLASASSSQEPQLDEEALATELQEFALFADNLMNTRSTKKRDSTPGPRPKLSPKKVSRKIAKELRKFRDDAGLTAKSLPASDSPSSSAPVTRPQAASSWFSSVLKLLSSKKFHYGCHLLGLISSLIILSFSSATALRLGATLVAANSLYSLYDLYSNDKRSTLGLIGHVPDVLRLAGRLASSMRSALPLVQKALVSFFSSIIQLLCTIDISGTFTSLFSGKTDDPSLAKQAEDIVFKDTLPPSSPPIDPMVLPPFTQLENPIVDFDESQIASSSTSAQSFSFKETFASIAQVTMEALFGTTDSKDIAARLRNFSIGVVAIKHAKDLFVMLQHLVVSSCNWISVKVTGVALFDDSGYRFAKSVDKLVIDAPEAMRIIRSPTATPQEIRTAEEWANELRSVYFANVHRDHRDAAMAELLRLYHSFGSLQSQFVGKLSEASRRVEPVAVLIHGGAGLAKTALITYLADMLTDLRVTSNSSQYHMLPDSDFEEGHRDQAHYIFDEFMTINDAELRKQHARKLLALVNVAPRPINYASVDNKGVHFDKSEFVWCTSNCKNLDTWRDLAADPAALARRFSLRIMPHLEGPIPQDPAGNIDWSSFNFNCWLPGDTEPTQFTLAKILTVLAEARANRIAHYNARLAQSIQDKRNKVAGYDALQKQIHELMAANPIRAQGPGLTDTFVRDQLFVYLSALPPQPATTPSDWKDCLKDLVENYSTPGWIPTRLILHPPEHTSDFPLAILYARCTCDEACARSLDAEYRRRTADQFTLFKEYGVATEDSQVMLTLNFRSKWPRLSKTLDFLAKCVSYLNPWSYTTSLVRTFVAASASAVFAVCMAIASVAVASMVMMRTWLSPSPNHTSINVSTPPMTHTQSARDKEERIRMRKARIIASRNANIGRRRETHPQAHDPNFSHLAHDSYAYLHISPYDPGARCVGLRGRFILTNFHVTKSLDSFGKVRLVTRQGDYTIPVKDLVRIEDAEDDLCLIELPKFVPEFPDITHRFIKDDDLITLGSNYARAVHAEGKEVCLEWYRDYVEPNIISYRGELSDYYHPFGLSLPICGIDGDCGTLVATFADQLNSRNLLGIHCAGNSECSQYTLVTQELLGILFSEVTHPQGHAPTIVPSSTLIETQKAAVASGISDYLIAPPSAKILGCTSIPDHIPRTTKQRRSLFYGKFGKPKRRPAALSRGQTTNGTDPLTNAYAAMQRLPQVSVDEVFQDCADQVFRYVKSGRVPRRTLTWDEAVKGIGNLPALVLDTSPGYPWTHHPEALKAKATTKEFFVKIFDDGTYWVHPDLFAKVEDDLEKLRQWTIPDWFFADKLKDELRPNDKVDAGKSRVFMAAPIDNHIVCRMLFGAIIAASDASRMQHPGLSSCAVGTQPRDLSISAMYQQLYGEEFEVHAHDQDKFDFHQQLVVALPVVRSINKWYGNSEDSLARETYVRAVYASVHISGCVVYQLAENGLPSGVFFTAHFNSWLLETCTLHVIHKSSLRQKNEGLCSKVLSPRQIKNAIFALYYGDDSWIAIPKRLITVPSSDFFDGYLELGLKATHCIKDWPIDQPVPIGEITFLKRKVFKNADGHVVFALEIDHIYDMLNFCHKSYFSSAAFYNSTARNMLTEIALHGKSEFGKLVSLMEASFTELNVPLTIPVTYADYV